LTKSLPKKGKQDFCVDSKAFVEAGWMIQETELEVCNPKIFICA
jgi:c-src tyrosine kinase